jgi:hypothetical protein
MPALRSLPPPPVTRLPATMSFRLRPMTRRLPTMSFRLPPTIRKAAGSPSSALPGSYPFEERGDA